MKTLLNHEALAKACVAATRLMLQGRCEDGVLEKDITEVNSLEVQLAFEAKTEEMTLPRPYGRAMYSLQGDRLYCIKDRKALPMEMLADGVFMVGRLKEPKRPEHDARIDVVRITN